MLHTNLCFRKSNPYKVQCKNIEIAVFFILKTGCQQFGQGVLNIYNKKLINYQNLLKINTKNI